MIKHTFFECRNCGACFDTELECKKHQIKCHEVQTFICDKCGGGFAFHGEGKNQNHQIDIGEQNGDCRLSGMDAKFNICDNCLADFVQSFVKVRGIK